MKNDAFSVSHGKAKRWIATAIAAVVAVALIGGGWFAATLFTSPAQRAAAAAAPSKVPVAVTVEQGDLVDTRTLSGTIRPIASFSAALSAPSGADRAVVTTVTATSGKRVKVGDVMATVNGAPVFAFESLFPFYRDMGLGDSGIDVRSLQQSLVSLGLLAEADGEFGQGTAAAVAQLFSRAGFAAPLRDAPSGDAATDAASTAEDPGKEDKAAAKPVKTVYMPVSATLAAPSLPAVVSSAPEVGADVSAGADFELTAKAFAIFVTLPDSLPGGLPAGTKVRVSGAGLDDARAVVHGAASIPVADADARASTSDGGSPDDADGGAADGQVGAPGDSGAAAVAEVRIDLKHPSRLTQKMSGQPVTVTAVVRTVASDALIVPVTAVDEADPAHGYVVIADGERAGNRVQVSIIGEVDGRVALEPGDELKAGDRVRVE